MSLSGISLRDDAAGNRLYMEVNGPSSGHAWYIYDAKDRLTKEDSTTSPGVDYTHAYDDAFNPTSLRTTTGLTYNDDNQRTGTGYGYDGNGNPNHL